MVSDTLQREFGEPEMCTGGPPSFWEGGNGQMDGRTEGQMESLLRRFKAL